MFSSFNGYLLYIKLHISYHNTVMARSKSHLYVVYNELISNLFCDQKIIDHNNLRETSAEK